MLEKLRQAEADQQEAEMLMSRAVQDKHWVEVHLEIVHQLRDALGLVGDETEKASFPLADSQVGMTAFDLPAFEPGAVVSAILGKDFWAFKPDVDEETGEPIYDARVVSGKRNSRERALAAARVYGFSLREQALAEAIFRTEETNAASAESIRGSLGGLVRHGDDWRRDRGQLVYQGDDLQPDREMIMSLARERESRRREQENQED